jgi:RNA polymerase-interacting CarD/CdnL/TRCF family regulator
MRSGRATDVAGVARDLAELSRGGRLGAGEEQMFRRSVRLLAGYVSFASDMPYDTARRQILEALR